jgi:AmmeMemoRadiSam system protein A
LPEAELDDPSRAQLVGVAAAAIRCGLMGLPPDAAAWRDLPRALHQPRPVFVTVTVDGSLNGCIGSLQPEPLAAAVSRLAWEAAFADPRLPALQWSEYPRADVKISVLSEPEALEVAGEDELIAALRPGVDGLIIAAGGRRATFLPAVWATLPDRLAFVHQLERKAGMRGWPRGARAWRYTSVEVGGPLGGDGRDGSDGGDAGGVA